MDLLPQLIDRSKELEEALLVLAELVECCYSEGWQFDDDEDPLRIACDLLDTYNVKNSYKQSTTQEKI